MRVLKFILLIILSIVSYSSFAQEASFYVNFRVGKSVIPEQYRGNETQLARMSSYLDSINRMGLDVEEVVFYGTASPEGSFEINKKLSKNRQLAFEKLVREQVDLSNTKIKYEDQYIPWDSLAILVEDSDIDHKNEILDVLMSGPRLENYGVSRHIDGRVLDLKKIDSGKVWQTLNREYFQQLRYAKVSIITKKRPFVSNLPAKIDTLTTLAPKIIPIVPLDETLKNKPFDRKFYLKTNVVGLGMLISNVSAELDLSKHWSINLPINYSAWNYFSSTVKFRTFSVQPELRYWFSNKGNDGWYAGVHAGLAYYNFATGGDWRTQDRDGNSPALGGGVGFGYRLPLTKNDRWKLEFGIGAGAYRLHYDKFENYHNGPKRKTISETYVGIDNIAISVSYTFDLNKKKK